MQSKHTHTHPLTYLYRYQMFEACLLEVKQMFHWHCCCTYQHYSTTKTTVVPLEKVRIDQIDTPPPSLSKALILNSREVRPLRFVFCPFGPLPLLNLIRKSADAIRSPAHVKPISAAHKKPAALPSNSAESGDSRETAATPARARVFYHRSAQGHAGEGAEAYTAESALGPPCVDWGEDCTVWRWSGAEETQPKPTTWYTHTHMGAVYTDTTHWFQIQKWIWYENNCFLRTPIKNRVFSRQTDK